MQILIATGNAHKLKEITAILPRRTETGEQLEYVSLTDILRLTLPPETGQTLAENAKQKAFFAARLAGMCAIADDTGLEVDGLNGRPGVYTARYAGEHANAAANNRKLLQELEAVTADKRTARFRTVACMVVPTGKTTFFEGVLEGSIAQEPRGQNGFGYDPLFIVSKTGKTLAEMSEEEKNKISHRGHAFRQLSDFLTKIRNG